MARLGVPALASVIGVPAEPWRARKQGAIGPSEADSPGLTPEQRWVLGAVGSCVRLPPHPGSLQGGGLSHVF